MQGPIALSDEQNRLIQKHLQLVLKANETTNLTRIQSEEEAELLHVEDSLQGIPECLEAPSGRYADLGSGGGFPGFAIAIATGRDTVLVESVGKRQISLSCLLVNSISRILSMCIMGARRSWLLNRLKALLLLLHAL